MQALFLIFFIFFYKKFKELKIMLQKKPEIWYSRDWKGDKISWIK